MRKRFPRRMVLSLAAIVAMAVISGIGAFLYRHFNLPGESVGSIPKGHVSDLAWHGDYLYFLHEATHIDSTSELWRIRPGGKAEQVNLPDSNCSINYHEALTESPEGALTLARWCDDFLEIVEVLPDTLNLERIALIERNPVPISRIARVGDSVFVAQDRAPCSGIAKVDGVTFISVPPLNVDGESLDVGVSFAKNIGQCTDSPQGGFVTPLGNSVAFLASTDAVGKPADKRNQADWTVYLTDAGWNSKERLADGFESPTEMASYKDCGLLIAAKRGWSSGIWLVRRNGHAEQVLNGRFSDFAVRPDGEAIAILGRDEDSSSLNLVRQHFKPACSPGY